MEGLHEQLAIPDQSLKVLARGANSGVIRTYELLPGDRIKPLRTYTTGKLSKDFLKQRTFCSRYGHEYFL